MSHPALTFSPQETADLCEAFDMAVAELQERDTGPISWADDGVKAALSAEIVQAWTQGEHDPKGLRDHALGMADKLFGPGRPA
jgi:hypothetical protein